MAGLVLSGSVKGKRASSTTNGTVGSRQGAVSTCADTVAEASRMASTTAIETESLDLCFFIMINSSFLLRCVQRKAYPSSLRFILTIQSTPPKGYEKPSWKHPNGTFWRLQPTVFSEGSIYKKGSSLSRVCTTNLLRKNCYLLNE